MKPIVFMFLLSAACSLQAVMLSEVAAKGPLKLFVAVKGAEMPSDHDQTNNLKEGDRALLLSGMGLTDLTGISTLAVVDEGNQIPISRVKNLHLFVNQNDLTALPEELSRLDNITFMYFEHNKRLRSIPESIIEMDALEGMYFTHCDFPAIPPFVFGMTRLKKLQFSQNHLTELPAAIGNLTELRHFNVADNQISSIPESMSSLTRLRVCDLSDNPFTSLPEAFGKVQIVNQLRVKNCPVTSLPSGFSTMRATIDITGTKIDENKLPPELRARINTEKPPGSKEPEKMIVKKKEKPQKGGR
ncbi:leucine-rich repeat domain-containing protein [Prosthecobacter sp.]|uniref:leucine-rich repeat domain-containing protein n=1 Tax=Prosthecobacter sp. TaxID=1965333 RepID=UPI0037851F3A